MKTNIGKMLLDLKVGECRWPSDIEIDGTFRFCAEPVVGCQYCAHHHALAYRPAPKVKFGRAV